MITTVPAVAPPAVRHRADGFTGTGALVRVALRQDRWRLAAWVAAFVAVGVGSAAATAVLYPTAEAARSAGEAVNLTPALLALYGPLHDPGSVGALGVWKPAGSGALLLAVLVLFTVVRHSRAQEEDGRFELAAAGAVGRLALIASASLVAAGTALAVGVLTAAGLVGVGLPVAGGVAFGAAWAGSGVAFAGVGAVSAQLTRSARSARVVGVAVLAGAFGLRAAGDAAGVPALTAASPLGWVQAVHAYAGEQWWLLSPPVLLGLALVALALQLAARRDLGAGLVPERGGPAAAGPGLHGATALALRLQRGPLVAWVVAFALLAALLGTVSGDVAKLLDSPQMQTAVVALGGDGALPDAFLAADLALFGMAAAGYAVAAVLRPAAEERAGRAELLLGLPVGRIRWALGHTAVAVLGAGVMLVVAGAVAGAARALHDGGAGPVVVAEALRLTGAALAQLPAVAVLAAATLVFVGLGAWPVTTSWTLFAGVVAVAELGALLRWPQWVLDLSPFSHVPHAPVEPVIAASLVVLVALALLLGGIGCAALRHRDISWS